MDIADVNKVASRKRMNIEAEKLREKVSRETAKIIKLKVAQDTAYWDLKEKLHQLENNHERLQQNMVDVQMDHETISGQYQDELRLRPETLNKLSSTREICDVLEDYSSRLKETLARCKADQGALCEAYQKSGHIVKEIKMKQVTGEERHKELVAGLEEKLKLTTEHQSQLVQLFNSWKQQAESQAEELRRQLEIACNRLEETGQRATALSSDLAEQIRLVDVKDKNIATLQNDMKALLHEFDVQADEMKNTITKQEKLIQELSENKESLRKALTNQEEYTKSVREENNTLQEKISSFEEETAKLYDEVTVLQGNLEGITSNCNTLRRDVATLIETKDTLEKDLDEKTQLLNNAAKEIERLIGNLDALQIEKCSIAADLTKVREASVEKDTQIDGYKNTVKEFEAKVAQLESALEDCKLSNEEKIKELNSTIESKQQENTSKGETINKLINEIKMCMEVRNRLESNIDKMKREIEIEREKGTEMEIRFVKQVEQLTGIVKDKEQELSKQMSIILEIRGEKEKLQSKISGMQGVIDNIQKELTGRVAPKEHNPLDQPELDNNDDNAVSLTPLHKSTAPPQPRQKCPEFLKPRNEPKQDMLFNMFSDSSMDGDALDPVVVNRRFEAISRGEDVPPTSLAALKRRRPPTAAHKPVFDDSPISLSQVRNEVKRKGNTFFKTKRAENKLKRFKKVDDLDAQ